MVSRVRSDQSCGELSRALARELEAGLRPEAEAGQVLAERVLVDTLRREHRPDVARLRHRACERHLQFRVVVVVVDRFTAPRQVVRNREHRRRLGHPLLDDRGHRQRLEHRSGFVGLLDHVVAPVSLLGGARFVRVDDRARRHCDDLEGPRVQDDEVPGVRARRRHLLGQRLFRVPLHIAVDRQPHTLTRYGIVAAAVPQRNALAAGTLLARHVPVAAAKDRVHGELESGLSVTVGTGEPDDVPRHGSCGIRPLRRRLGAHPTQPQLLDGAPGLRRDPLGDVGEPLVAGEGTLDGPDVDAKQGIELERVRRRVRDEGLIDGQVVHLHRPGQGLTVAVEDGSAKRRDLRGP